MSNRISRRELIQHAALSAGLAALGGVWLDRQAKASTSPNEKLNIACIGVGGQGASDLGHFVHENIVAMCDVDDARAADSFKAHPEARKYYDYRQMLEKEAKNIDAVVVSTPDHHHAPASAMAIKLGKHVYCQKPLTHTVDEARALMNLARKHKVVTQMGTQGHPSYVRLVEYIEKGVIGPVTEVHVMTDRPAGWWPQGIERPTTADPIPPTLKWDLWLGPAPERPYNHAYLPFVWRGWWDFGTGALGDMACHLMDGAFWSLKLQYPTTVEAEGEPLLPDSCPKWMVVHYEFPPRGDMPAVKLHWYDSNRRPPEDVMEGITLKPGFNGSIFVGEKGKLLVPHGGEPQPFPKEKFPDFEPPAPYLPRVADHYQQWVDACKHGGETGSNFDYAAVMTESVLLGNVAFRVGKKLEWDAKHMRASNAPEADQYVKHHYRRGWSL
ncbi:MAG: Gfo/Idh/MocA family protein [Chthonomonadales bacterium]